MEDSLPDKLDQHEVAKYFNVTTRTIRTWVAQGTIPPPLRIGRRQCWIMSDLSRWLERGSARRFALSPLAVRTLKHPAAALSAAHSTKRI